jgi:hypothetical protein
VVIENIGEFTSGLAVLGGESFVLRPDRRSGTAHYKFSRGEWSLSG